MPNWSSGLSGHFDLVWWDYVPMILKKSWSVQTVFMMERIDIRYLLVEVARDKRFVESLQWRSQEIFFAQENFAACDVDGMHTIKTWIGLMKWNTYQGHEFEKPFTILLFPVRKRPEVCCLCLVTAAENVSVQFVFCRRLGPLSKTCLLQKWLPLSAVKAIVIPCDRWCLYSCD